MKKKEECYIFFCWGCFFGICIPLFSVLLIDIFYYIPNIKKSILTFYGMGLSIIVIATSLSGTFISYRLYDTRPHMEKQVDYLLYLIGFFVCFFIGILVVLTGGVLKSLFSFYFIYLPSVVAVAFSSKKNNGLKIVSLLCILMIVIGLFFPVENSEYNKFYSTMMHKMFYLGIAIMQLFAIFFLEINRQNGEVES